MSEAASPALARWKIDDRVPALADMPLLERWLQRAERSRPLRGVTALMLQHQLGNQVPQTEALIRLGLAPERIHWIDIPYTSTPRVREALRGLGIPAAHLHTGDFRLLQDYAPYQRLRVQKFLRDLAASPPEHLLVLDDGSYLLEALSCQRHALPRLSIVEQTTRGLIKIDENAALAERALEAPVVNVAGSDPKKYLEPPFIGAAVCDKLLRGVGARLRPGPRDRCLLLGYGAIGRQVAAFASHRLGFARERIHVHDPNEVAQRQALRDGFAAFDRRDRTQRFTLVLGCSGRESFKVGDHVLLEDGACLASATSGTVELSRERFIELAEASPYDDVWIVKQGLDEANPHSDIDFHFMGRGATFLNGGFPVNFDGGVNCVPPHYIQPTATLMCAAAVQAVAESRRGIVPLDTAFGLELCRDFRRELGAEAALVSAAPG